jgi:hypothetical protein
MDHISTTTKAIILSFAVLLFSSSSLQGQAGGAGHETDPVYRLIVSDSLRASSVYHNYTYVPQNYTKVPHGFKPVYAVVYARHGARWLGSADEYKRPLSFLASADSSDNLTPLGKSLYARVLAIAEDASLREGSLTPKGRMQHREIAGRFYERFRPLLRKGGVVEASSTSVQRCILSMAAFCGRLSELNPKLDVRLEQTGRTHVMNNFFKDNYAVPSISSNASRIKTVNDSLMGLFDYDAFMSRIFIDPSKCSSKPASLANELYYIAADQQDLENGISIYDVFTAEDLYILTLRDNWRFYNDFASTPLSGGYSALCSGRLLNEVFGRADSSLARYSRADRSGTGSSGGKRSRVVADLHFGHDVNVIALSSLLAYSQYSSPVAKVSGRKANESEGPARAGLSDVPERIDASVMVSDPVELARLWSDHSISPMASNIQLLFYRNHKGETLVKFLHNEREMRLPIPAWSGPYYSYDSVRSYIDSRLASLRK